jgi:hypothetical protein
MARQLNARLGKVPVLVNPFQGTVPSVASATHKSTPSFPKMVQCLMKEAAHSGGL